MKATSGSGPEARPTTEPVGRATASRSGPNPAAGEHPAENVDDLVMILLPRAAWDATAALGRRLGAATGGPPIPPAAVMGLALKRLQEDTDRRLGKEG
jgi:hypothetical protein